VVTGHHDLPPRSVTCGQEAAGLYTGGAFRADIYHKWMLKGIMEDSEGARVGFGGSEGGGL